MINFTDQLMIKLQKANMNIFKATFLSYWRT